MHKLSKLLAKQALTKGIKKSTAFAELKPLLKYVLSENAKLNKLKPERVGLKVGK